MEDDKRAHHEPGGGNREKQSQPVRDFHTADHQIPKSKEGNERIDHLPQTAPQVGAGITSDHILPANFDCPICDIQFFIHINHPVEGWIVP